MELILASSSPYRRALLERLALPFSVDPPALDETPQAGERPRPLALRLARAKAAAVAARRPGAVVIGSDQVATLDGMTPIGKPGGLAEARRQLAAASGRSLQFHTAFCVAAPGRTPIVECVDVVVRYRDLGAAEIDRYLTLEQPFDCAGSAKAEGLGIALLAAIDSDDPTALIGLPLIRLVAVLRSVGIDPLAAGRSGVRRVNRP
ncbi:MAG: Maf family nucleotide pyrophosphatase [Lautropia sp.]